ncbi:MAG: hypothetical protein NUW37_07770 [Planctomycetes bacterium]|nr:hypothetical protein [Planctomycetota bacterium]
MLLDLLLPEGLVWMSFDEFVEWCDHHEGFIVGISTLLYVLFTVVVIVQTKRAARDSRLAIKEMQASREAEFRPQVFFDLTFNYNQGTVFANIENKGRMTAHDISFKFSESVSLIDVSHDDNGNRKEKEIALAEARWLKNLNSLIPGRSFKIFLGVTGSFLKLNRGKRQLGFVEYRDPTGKNLYREPIDIEVEDYVEMAQLRESDMQDLIRSIKDIERALQQIARR